MMVERGNNEMAVDAVRTANIPRRMSPPRDPGHMTEIPKQFLLPSTSSTACTVVSTEQHSRLHDAVHNIPYEKKIAQTRAVRQRTGFRVPVEMPLPPTTVDYLEEAKARNSRTESSLASLFSAAATTGVERPKLEFLAPAEHNRRREIEERMKNESHPRSDPNAKREMNEPKKMPNLDKKVPKDFVPQCASVLTRAAAMYMEECKRQRHDVESRETPLPRARSPLPKDAEIKGA